MTSDHDELAKTGAVILRGAIPPSMVIDARRALSQEIEQSTLGRREDGRLVVHQEGCEGWWRPYAAMQSCEEVHRLATAAAIQTTLGELLGTSLLHHVRRPITLLYAGLHVPPYQTLPLIQGDPDTLCVWVPLEARTDGKGKPIRAPAKSLLALRSNPEAGAELADLPPEITDSATGFDVEPGDAVLYHSLSIRGVGANLGNDLLMSIEFRVQRRWSAICRASMEPHHYPRVPGSAALTRGWTDRSLLRTPALVRLSRFHMPSTVERWHLELDTPRSELLSGQHG